MAFLPACPQCTMENTYPDAGSFMLKACFLKKA